ncbi:uncharacterized protein LOC129216339 [Uloborus diversus]|uniref:uncharacterized protein LOC129216339 n=1 Tax=Uloborus diversus TaxID=327109 RepID=UPI002409E79E|nr:uncharacterized protein LOC129216339 [Uloborus diversus]
MHLNIIPRTLNSEQLERNNTRHNVLIIGIDSLSRLSFIRQLPKTYKFLKETLNAYVFRGMTKIGDNTFPNLAAILTGKSAGYVSFFAEDLPDLNLFNYYRGGFRNAPTDHYMRPFWIAMQTSRLYRFSSHLCFGRMPKHLLQIHYLKDFVSKYSNLAIPFFAFSFFVELSHDYINEVSLADEDFHSLLKELLLSGYLNRTYIFFLSDHGHRFDSLRETLIGRIEERMPFFAVTLPQDMNKSLLTLQNLRVNQGRLTSSYDVYFTLMDILSNSVNNTKLGYKTSSRGTTLFGPIFGNRTCQTAGIPDHYCTCETEETISNEDPRAKEAATVLVNYINNFLDSHRNQCSLLSLSEIRRTDLILPNQKTVADSRRQPNMTWRDILLEYGKAKGIISKLRVIVKTVPGNALFEGTLQYREDDKSMTVLGDISRINKYGSQSMCVKDAILRKYCYCLEN